MNEDEVLSRITRLLEQGCTMLATHHECGAPLFRCQGEVVCPVCSFAEKSDIDRAHLLQRKEINGLPPGKEARPTHKGKQDDEEFNDAIDDLRASLLHSLQEIAAILKDERDLDKMKKLLDCLEALLRAVRSLQG